MTRHRLRDDWSVKFRDTVAILEGQKCWVITAKKDGVTGTGVAPYAPIVRGQALTGESRFNEATEAACVDLENRLAQK